jgi:hypothetical protein
VNSKIDFSDVKGYKLEIGQKYLIFYGPNSGINPRKFILPEGMEGVFIPVADINQVAVANASDKFYQEIK